VRLAPCNVVKCVQRLASRLGPSDGARGHVAVDPFECSQVDLFEACGGHVFNRALSTCNPLRLVEKVIYKVPYYPVGWLCIRLQSVRSNIHVFCICPLADSQHAYSLHFSLFTALGTEVLYMMHAQIWSGCRPMIAGNSRRVGNQARMKALPTAEGFS